MRLLLDTPIFLWLMNGSRRLSRPAKALIESADTVFVSSATIWEIALKVQLGKLTADLDEVIEQIDANGFAELSIYARHAKEVAKLPRHHGDPFDRLLIAQAISETMRLLTSDAHLTAYSELVECV
jgi:PIN domain nuclease of toxin-antitoxin system